MTTIRSACRKAFGPRKKHAHKGDYGHVFVIAGSRAYTGAAYFAAMAALRSGSGLVTLAVPESLYGVMARKVIDVMLAPVPDDGCGCFVRCSLSALRKVHEGKDVVILGPGLGRCAETATMVRALYATIDVPVVLDADGLNAFVGYRKRLVANTRPVIITPHPGECDRLFGTHVRRDPSTRRAVACRIAADYRVIVVLKGHRTVVASPDGAVYVNGTGNPGMAVGGTGDCLSGMIASFVGQGIAPFDAARFGAYLHGLAGDRAARRMSEQSMIASDLLEDVPAVFKALRR